MRQVIDISASHPSSKSDTYAEVLSTAKSIHLFLIRRALSAESTRDRTLYFSQADEMIDVAGGVDPADWHQILTAKAYLQLKRRSLDRLELERRALLRMSEGKPRQMAPRAARR